MNCIWTTKRDCPFFTRIKSSVLYTTSLQPKQFIANINTSDICIICNQIRLLGEKPELNIKQEGNDLPPTLPFKQTEGGLRSFTLDEINEIVERDEADVLVDKAIKLKKGKLLAVPKPEPKKKKGR